MLEVDHDTQCFADSGDGGPSSTGGPGPLFTATLPPGLRVQLEDFGVPQYERYDPKQTKVVNMAGILIGAAAIAVVLIVVIVAHVAENGAAGAFDRVWAAAENHLPGSHARRSAGGSKYVANDIDSGEESP